MTSKINNKDSKIKTPKSHSQDSIPSFIRKTYDILDERKFPDVIDWNLEGNALVIKNPTEFCQKVLPAYFKHNNLTSFVRQLNMYNFHKRRTQNLDHIYYHELFQQGKKHLLCQIRRKSHGDSAEKTHKVVESPEVDAPEGQDLSTLAYENEFLKRLYNEAMSKIGALESQINDMTTQNQSLLSRFNEKNQRSSILKPLFDKYEKPELTQEQLPMTFGEFSIPPLKLDFQETLSLAKPACVNSFFNLGEEATESTATEVSQGSPSLVQTTESDKCFDLSEAGYLPALSLSPQVSQVEMAKPKNDLFISRGDMSVGQLFDAWGSEQMSSTTQEASQDSSLLGKRSFEQNGDLRFDFPEPALKRNDLSIFSKKGLFSAGLEDFDTNLNIDLMDFNCGWTKTA